MKVLNQKEMEVVEGGVGKYSNSKFLVMALLLTMAITGLYSCKKSESSQNEYSNNLKKNAKELASLHNSGMDFISLKFNNTNKINQKTGPFRLMQYTGEETVNGDFLLQGASEFIYGYDKSKEIVYLIPELAPALNYLLDNGTESVIKQQFANATQDAISLAPVTAREADLVADVSEILSEAYSMNLNQIQTYNYIQSELDGLQKNMDNITYIENEGELINGLIEIGTQSNIYWSGHSSNINIPTVSLIQMDLVGYIFGWAQAVRADYNAGTLRPSGQRARIEQGVWGALGFSAGGLKFR